MAKENRLIAASEVKKKLVAVRQWFSGPPSTEQDKLARAVVKMCIEEVEKIKPADAVEAEKYNELKARYKKLLETAEILDSALREYQQKYGDLEV